MANSTVVRSNTPTKGKKRPEQSKLHERHAKIRQAEQANRNKMANYVANRHLVLPKNENCIDTVRISLPERAVLKDRDYLSKQGFTLRPSGHRAKKCPDGSLIDPSAGHELWMREVDCCRVMLWPTKPGSRGLCVIEVSLPRLLGLPNHRLHELGQHDVCHAFELLTCGLLPWTTDVADAHDRWWAIIRLDLARDFAGNAQDFVNAYEFSRWGRVRNPPLPEKFKFGLLWANKRDKPNQLRFYDKGEEIIHSATCTEDLEGAPPPGTVVRVERQWRGKSAFPSLKSLLLGSVSDDDIRAHGQMLRFVDRQSEDRVATFPVCLRSLHTALAHEISLLGSKQVPASDRHEAMARACMRDPIFLRDHKSNWGKQSHADMLKLMGQIQRNSSGLDLLNAAYGSNG